MERNSCVICEGIHFIYIYNDVATFNMATDTLFNENERKELNFVGCTNCGCVQLHNLYNPSYIYNKTMVVYKGSKFSKHDNLLNEFIIKNNNWSKDILEIGGSFGVLAKLIIEKYKQYNSNVNYKILEFDIEKYPTNENIKYISGNCENFNYMNTDTIIMSHVFEHLYKPRDFVKKISESDVRNVFISIPDMENLINKNNDINNLNIYHTYYIDTNFIKYIFNCYGYELKDIYNFENNSVFYYFVKNINQNNNLEYKNVKLLDNIKFFYMKMKNNIIINEPFYICPSGNYGKFIYNYLNEQTKNNLLGFLDSCVYKIGKRLEGTNKYIYKKEKIMNYDKINILLVAGKYNDEIKDELINYNKNINLIYPHN